MAQRLLLIATTLLTFASWAQEREMHIAYITNDIVKDGHKITLGLNAWDEIMMVYIDTYVDAKRINRYSMGIPDLTTGWQLDHDGVEVLRVQSNDFTAGQGGTLNFRYLNNGITGKYRAISIQLIHPPHGEWASYTMKNEQIYRLHLQAKKFLGKVIGIDEVLINPAIPIECHPLIPLQIQLHWDLETSAQKATNGSGRKSHGVQKNKPLLVLQK